MRDTVTVIHRAAQGSADYVFHLTFEFQQEEGQWVGVCLELGTPAQSDTLEQVGVELREAVELQLNEVDRLCDIHDYLKDYGVRIVPIEVATSAEQCGFVVATTGY